MKSLVFVLGFLAVAMLRSPVMAAEPPLHSDRPTQTHSAITVPAHQIQDEWGYTHDRTGDVTLDTLGEWLFRWGVVRDFEVFVALGSYAWRNTDGAGTERGWSDSGLGFRWTSQHGAGARPTAALIVGTSLPTGGSAFVEDTLQPEAIVAMEWKLGGRTALRSNVAWGWASVDLHRFDRWWGSLVLDVNVGRKFILFGEGYGYLRETPGGSTTGYLNAGARYRVSSRVQLDVRGGLGRNGIDDDWLLGVGVTWRTDGP